MLLLTDSYDLVVGWTSACYNETHLKTWDTRKTILKGTTAFFTKSASSARDIEGRQAPVALLS